MQSSIFFCFVLCLHLLIAESYTYAFNFVPVIAFPSCHSTRSKKPFDSRKKQYCGCYEDDLNTYHNATPAHQFIAPHCPSSGGPDDSSAFIAWAAPCGPGFRSSYLQITPRLFGNPNNTTRLYPHNNKAYFTSPKFTDHSTSALYTNYNGSDELYPTLRN